MNVRGLGALKPEEIHWIAAAQDSRVSQVVRRAGIDPIKANDVILVLSDPDLELEAEKAEWQLKQDEAQLANLESQARKRQARPACHARRARIASDDSQADGDRDLELTRLNLKSDLESRLSVNNANQLQNRVALQKQRLGIQDEAIKAQIDAQQVVVESSRAAYELKREDKSISSRFAPALTECCRKSTSKWASASRPAPFSRKWRIRRSSRPFCRLRKRR